MLFPTSPATTTTSLATSGLLLPRRPSLILHLLVRLLRLALHQLGNLPLPCVAVTFWFTVLAVDARDARHRHSRWRALDNVLDTNWNRTFLNIRTGTFCWFLLVFVRYATIVFSFWFDLYHQVLTTTVESSTAGSKWGPVVKGWGIKKRGFWIKH